MKRISLPHHDQIKFAIFGKIHYLDYFIEKLHEYEFLPPLVITSPEDQYERDKRFLTKYGFWSKIDNLAERGLIVKKIFENVNDPDCRKEIVRNNCNVGFSINCRNIIKRPLIDLFEGRIFNIHDSFLPDERGGGLNTWRILNGVRVVGNTIHQIDEGIDSGDIAFQEKAELEAEYPLPIDYDKAQISCIHKIFDQFISVCVENRPISIRPQDNASSVYFPRLYTEINGAINWDWDVSDVEKFIRAFSDPYPGAYTFLKAKKLHILRADVASANIKFHPFCNGKVIRVLDDGSIGVVAGGKCLFVRKVSWERGEVVDASKILNTRHTLHTLLEVLDKARLYIPKTQEMK